MIRIGFGCLHDREVHCWKRSEVSIVDGQNYVVQHNGYRLLDVGVRQKFFERTNYTLLPALRICFSEIYNSYTRYILQDFDTSEIKVSGDYFVGNGRSYYIRLKLDI